MSRTPASQRAELGLLVGAALLLLTGLGGTDLWAPDEPRYAQIAEELRSLQHGSRGLVLLHLNGEAYTQKPPAYFWLAAAAGSAFGRVSETAARLPSAFAGLGLVWLTLVFGRGLLGARSGLLGAALLLTCFEFAWLARRAQLDVLLALFETLGLFAYWRIEGGVGSRRRALACLHASLGLAVLTKGPVGLLVPLLVVVTDLGLRRRWRALPGLLPPWGLLLSVGPGLLWLAVTSSLGPPGYLEEAVGTNVFGRFFAGTSHARPFYYYLYQLPVDFLPWTLLLPAVYVVGRRHVFGDGADRDPQAVRAWTFLLAWVGASLAFFSLSGGKRGLYLLPAFPALALLCADAWRRILGAAGRVPRPLAWGLALLALLLALAGLALASAPMFPYQDVDALGLSAAGFAALSVVAAALLLWRRTRTPGSRVFVPLGAVFGIELAIFLLVLPALDAVKSPRPIAIAAARLAGPDGRIGLLGNRAMTGGLVYYGRRPVAQLSTPDDVGNFLRSGGSAVVARAKHLDWVRQVVPVEVRGKFREGGRAMHLLSAPRDAAAQAPEPPADP